MYFLSILFIWKHKNNREKLKLKHKRWRNKKKILHRRFSLCVLCAFTTSDYHYFVVININTNTLYIFLLLFFFFFFLSLFFLLLLRFFFSAVVVDSLVLFTLVLYFSYVQGFTFYRLFVPAAWLVLPLFWIRRMVSVPSGETTPTFFKTIFWCCSVCVCVYSNVCM